MHSDLARGVGFLVVFRFETRSLRRWGSVIALAGLLACDGAGKSDSVPAAGSPAPTGAEPLRVVSLSPAASRFVVALGAADLLVGTDELSSHVPGLGRLPVIDLEDAVRLAPDIVLVPTLPATDVPSLQALRSSGAELIEFALHDFGDLFALSRDLGARLVGDARARSFERELARPLASIGGSSFGQPRPRVIAVVGFDPLELAGGHSFETDLIEIAGGTSVTHGGDESRLSIEEDRWPELTADLILVVTRRERTLAERGAALEVLPTDIPVDFFVFDNERFWLHDAEETAQRLRAVLLRAPGPGRVPTH